MQAAANPLQAAFYAVLVADTGPGGLLETGSEMVEGVFDFAGVPEGQPMPYVTIGEVISTPFTTFGREGEDVTATLKIYTQARGMKTANAILKRVNQLLGNATLTVAGYSLARSIFSQYSLLIDPDDGSETIVVSYRVWLQET